MSAKLNPQVLIDKSVLYYTLFNGTTPGQIVPL